MINQATPTEPTPISVNPETWPRSQPMKNEPTPERAREEKARQEEGGTKKS